MDKTNTISRQDKSSNVWIDNLIMSKNYVMFYYVNVILDRFLLS